MLNTIVLSAAAGLMTLLAGPALLSRTDHGPKVANAYASFVFKALSRPAITVGKHGDLMLRQLSYDEIFDSETMTTDGVERKVTRTAENVHRFSSTPLAFVEEVWGVTFDLRDVLIGRLEHEHRDDGEMTRTYSEFDDSGRPIRLERFWRGFFELDERPALSMNLNQSVRPIIDGSEKAHWHEQMDEAVRRMFVDREQSLGFLKLLLPGVGLGIGLVLGYYLLGPGQMPGGGGNVTDTISVGAIIPLSFESVREQLTDVYSRVLEHLTNAGEKVSALPWRTIGIAVGALSALVLAGLGALTLGVATSIIASAGFIIGFSVLPVLVLVFGAIGRGASIGELIIMSGLMGLGDPVLDLTEDDKYRFEEADELGLVDPPQVKLAKTLIGLSCEVSPKAFGSAGYDAADVEETRDSVATDGGADLSSCLPRNYEPTEQMTKAGHSAFVPADANASKTYVRADKWLARFRDAATGDRLDVAEAEAKKEYAAGDPQLSDGQLMRYTMALAIAGFGFWVVIAFAF